MSPRAAPADDSAHRQRFRKLWDDHYADVLAFALRRVGDREIAADVVAETYLTAWRRRDQLPDDARPWLFGAARKIIGNTRRGEGRRVALLIKLSGEASVDPGAPALHRDDDDATRLRVAEAFARLSARDREVLALVAWEELTPSEAARALDMPTARLSVRLHRAKQRLRRQLPTPVDPADPTPSTAPHPVSEIRS